MKKLLLILPGLLLLAACAEEAKPGADKENNTFFAEYRSIYRSYGVQPLDSTRLRLKAFLEEFPNDPKAWVFYGKVCYDLGRPEEAERAYQTAITHNPKYSLAYSSLGALAYRSGKLAEADAFLSKAVQLGDSSPTTYINLGMLKNAQQKPEDVLTLAEASVKYNQSADALAWAGSACLFHLAGKSELARQYFDSAALGGKIDTGGLASVLKGELKAEEYLAKLR